MQNDDIENKRKELELSLANQYHMTDRSKYELIRKIMDVLEESMEDGVLMGRVVLEVQDPEVEMALYLMVMVVEVVLDGRMLEKLIF